MSRLTTLIDELAEDIKRLELTSLVYFHTDHFEPWRSIDERSPAVGQQIVDGIHEFLRECERIDFAKRLTLSPARIRTILLRSCRAPTLRNTLAGQRCPASPPSLGMKSSSIFIMNIIPQRNP
jgi:hypothetical protein